MTDTPSEESESTDPAAAHPEESVRRLRYWAAVAVTVFVLICICGILLLTGRGGSDSPVDVAQAFLSAMATDDCQALEDLAAQTINDVPRGEFFGDCEQGGSDTSQPDVEAPLRLTEETSDRATVEVAADPVSYFGLVNEDGEWKVHEIIVLPPS